VAGADTRPRKRRSFKDRSIFSSAAAFVFELALFVAILAPLIFATARVAQR
jgi:hypothetical protein